MLVTNVHNNVHHFMEIVQKIKNNTDKLKLFDMSGSSCHQAYILFVIVVNYMYFYTKYYSNYMDCLLYFCTFLQSLRS